MTRYNEQQSVKNMFHKNDSTPMVIMTNVKSLKNDWSQHCSLQDLVGVSNSCLLFYAIARSCFPCVTFFHNSISYSQLHTASCEAYRVVALEEAVSFRSASYTGSSTYSSLSFIVVHPVWLWFLAFFLPPLMLLWPMVMMAGRPELGSCEASRPESC